MRSNVVRVTNAPYTPTGCEGKATVTWRDKRAKLVPGRDWRCAACRRPFTTGPTSETWDATYPISELGPKWLTDDNEPTYAGDPAGTYVRPLCFSCVVIVFARCATLLWSQIVPHPHGGSKTALTQLRQATLPKIVFKEGPVGRGEESIDWEASQMDDDRLELFVAGQQVDTEEEPEEWGYDAS